MGKLSAIFVYLVAIIVSLPCFLIFNESGNFLPNLMGFTYIGVLFITFRGKVAKKAYKALIKANKVFGLQ